MGYNTTVLILNDAFGEIERHPEEFVAGLKPFVNGAGYNLRENRRDHEIGHGDVSFPVGHYANGVSVIDVQHADATQVIMVGGNHATLLGEAYYAGDHHTRQGVKDTLNQVLKSAGLRVTEIPLDQRTM